MRNENKLMGAGLLTAISASLCCITPIITLIAGTSGLTSTFSWMEPFRPYLIALTLLVLSYAWYQKLKPHKKEIDCDCETDNKFGFMNSKAFLAIVTFIAIIMLAFPYYSRIFYSSTEQQITKIDQLNIKTSEFKIKGMTCTGCEIHIEGEVNKLNGIINVKANYEKGNTVIKYNKTKVTYNEIEKAIKNTDYKIIE